MSFSVPSVTLWLAHCPAEQRRQDEQRRHQPQDDGLGEYPLDDEQTKQVAKILGFRPEPERFYYYVEPYDPPLDCGFQEGTA